VYQGMKKNYMIELEIPPASRELTDLQKAVSLAVAECTVQTVDGQQTVDLKAKLDVVVLNPNEDIGGGEEENQEVIENYYRVKSAEVMDEARKIADGSKYEEA